MERRGADHWRRLTRALALEAQQAGRGGFGELTVVIILSDRVPQKIRVTAWQPTYQLDRDCAEAKATQNTSDVV